MMVGKMTMRTTMTTYVTKQKPVLSDDLKEALAIRAAQKRRPIFQKN